MSDCFILLAAGKGKRFKSNTLKVIKGGSERFESSKRALEYIKNKEFKNVYIHDAARPNFSIKLLKRLNRELNNNKAVVPYTNTDHSVKYREGANIFNLKRENLILTQTPQCFDFKTLYKLSNKNKKYISDEATLFIKNNLKIKFIKGEEDNIKITTTKDLEKIKLKTFYGIGFDIHRLVKGKKLYLGGIHIPYHSGLKGHSDGDVIIHSIIDALLGCMKKNDIGTLYPNNDLKYKNIRSTKMLKPVLDTLKKENYNLNNIDINLICEKPSVAKNRSKIIKSLSKLLQIKKHKINLKGKTVEKLGIIGKEKAIACEVIVSVSNYD